MLNTSSLVLCNGNSVSEPLHHDSCSTWTVNGMIIGDRQTGKTSIKTIPSWTKSGSQDVIHVAIGQKEQLVRTFKNTEWLYDCNLPGFSNRLHLLYPYVACYGRRVLYNGKHVSLTSWWFCQTSRSLMNSFFVVHQTKPPVFYLHSRLLERSASQMN